MSKGRVRLPPLVLDGEAKVLHKMTLRELHVCLTRALRVAGGDSVEESGRSVFSIMQQPSWWPQELPFDAKFTQKLPPDERSVIYRHLLNACYSYYKQEDTLHLFDSTPGEPPRWRLVQDGDEYTIVSTFTDRSIWTYSTNYQILPLITLAARQAEQYRASLGERLKKSKSDQTRDLVIQTRSQKASIPRQQDEMDYCGFGGDDQRGTDDGDGTCPMSPKSKMLLSPDGSPRRFSIMNRLSTTTPRFALPESYGDQLPEAEQRPSQLRCVKCNAEFSDRQALLEHLVTTCRQDKCDPAAAARSKDTKKDLALALGLGLAPRAVVEDYKKAIVDHVPKMLPAPKIWKPQFVGCQIPLSSELGRRLFATGKSDRKAEFEKERLRCEKYCATRPEAKAALLEEENASEDTKENVDEKKKTTPEKSTTEASDKGKEPTITNLTKEIGKAPTKKTFGKIYPVVYRPPRMIFHVHTYKFTMAERRLYDRMQMNGGLGLEARRLMKRCAPMAVDVTRLTDEELNRYGVSLDESDEEESDGESEGTSVEPDDKESAKPKGRRPYKRRRSTSRTPIVTRSQNQKSVSAIRAVAMVRKKYWANNVHLMKRIGGTVIERPEVEKRKYKKRKRRSRRGLVPRRRFSVEDGTDQTEQDQPTGSSSAPSSPTKMGWIKKKTGLPIKKTSRWGSFVLRSPKGRPRREHRVPVRYRTPERDEAKEKRKLKKEKKLAEAAAIPASLTPPPKASMPKVKVPLQQKIKDEKEKVKTMSKKEISKKEMDAHQQVAAIVAKILKEGIPEPAPVNGPSIRKGSRPLSGILPKQSGSTNSSTPEAHAPPPYSMYTAEHVYTTLGGHYNFNVEQAMPSKGFGRFMTPRPLSPATEDRIRDTVNEVVETLCGAAPMAAPAEAAGLRYYEGCADELDMSMVKEEIDEDAASRCSSESTIVSAIFEVPSSDEDSDDEQKMRYRRKSSYTNPLPWHLMEEAGEDVPAAKRLKMTFSEICAVPQKLWSRPAIMGGRKPAILGGRVPLIAVIGAPLTRASGDASSDCQSSFNTVVTSEGLTTGDGTKKGDAGLENGQDAAIKRQAGAEKNEAAVSGKSSTPTVVPTVPNATTSAQTKQFIQVSSTAVSSGHTHTIGVSAAGGPTAVSVGGKTYIVQSGCRVVSIKNMQGKTDGATIITTTKPAITVSASRNAPSSSSATAIASGTPVRMRSRVSAVVTPGMVSAGFPVRRSTPVTTVNNFVTTTTAPMASVVAAPKPFYIPISTASPQIFENTTSNYICFKCNFCSMNLSFANDRARESIQHHMTAAHPNMSHKLRRIKRKGSVIIEAAHL